MLFLYEKSEKSLAYIITEKIISDQTGLFDEVYANFIYEYIEELNIRLKQMDFSKFLYVDENAILLSAGRSFRDVLLEISKKTLIAELYNHKDYLVGDCEKEKYNYFCSHYLKENYSNIFGTDCHLYKIINSKMKIQVDAFTEMMHHLLEDICEVEEKFKLNLKTLVDIDLSCGDTHNYGKTVCIFKFNDNQKVVYKPHSLSNDGIYEHFTNMLNESNGIKHPLRSVPYLNMVNRGWQFFIKPQSCNSDDEAKRYMYRLGSIIGLTYLLKTTDIHFENIIACGEFPYLVDLETIVFNGEFYRKKITEVYGKFTEKISDSVFTSLILPQNYDFQKHQVELSGLAGGYGDENYYTVETVVDCGTSNIRFDSVRLDLKKTQNIMNIPNINGDAIDLINYRESLLEGFEDVYRYILENRSKIERLLNDDDAMSGHFRQVLRPTALYSKYLQASYHPHYMSSEANRDRVFQCLKSGYAKEPTKNQLIELEISQLSNEDIPYFYTSYNATSLYGTFGTEIQDFYDKSIKDMLLSRLDKFNYDDLTEQKYFIESALSTSKLIDKKNISPDNTFLFEEVVMGDDCKENIENTAIFIGDWIRNNRMIFDKQKDFCSFHDLKDSENGYKLGVIDSILYKGGGLALFYLCLYETFGKKEDLDTFKASMRVLNEQPLESYSEHIGVFEGIGSLIYLNFNAYKMTQDDNYYRKFTEATEYLMENKIEDTCELDVISGLSGIILMSLDIYENHKEQLMLKLARKSGEILLKNVMKSDFRSLTGFAHGASGISAALIKLGHMDHSSEYYDAGIDLVNYENRYFSEKYNNWIDLRKTDDIPQMYWCYGTPGITVARGIAYKYVHEKDKKLIEKDIQIGLTALKDIDAYPNNFSLCHGISGNLDIYYQISNQNQQFDRNSIDNLDVVNRLIMDLKKNGLTFESPLNTPRIDFMTGLSGLGYFLLRCINKRVPFVLGLESVRD